MAIETVSIRVEVPRPLQREFKAACAADGLTMTWVIVNAIKSYLLEYRQKHTPPQPQEPADAD